MVSLVGNVDRELLLVIYDQLDEVGEWILLRFRVEIHWVIGNE